ncbi:hypothetical protein BRADO0469 [Bradyrhizobium sp. ORS 278]|uniref:helix-turn-helix domain-containing protein n=1 Tax=Bradyrhizobium sp. (strain ORS 278) TaxID=114615 RepID=UPI00015077BF|nr:helix-turn-helix domain-containing protein [Bradyrhizobium sp. ORS 278]CAL74412.1 hypothetical protein BRADO0469 [Bradyrhizobium sp. ORS 278]
MTVFAAPKSRTSQPANPVGAQALGKLKILEPFNGLEAISVPEASRATGVPETTLRRWTREHGLGRRVGGHVRPWTLSRIALAMHLAGDRDALAAYHLGIRQEESVARYYRNEGLARLLRLPAFN